MANDQNYKLSPGVRARTEKFGLLFYNSKDTNLTFVKSGNMLTIKPAYGNRYVLEQHCADHAGKEKINRLMKILLEKGLIVEVRTGI